MINVVNAVGGGYLERELDLEALQIDLDTDSCKFNSSNPSRMYPQLREDSPTISLFRSGKYSIACAESVDELHKENYQFKKEIKRLGVMAKTGKVDFNTRYLVGIGDLGYQLNLSEVLATIGAEAEYEPEQFPGLYYSPSGTTTYVIFSTGKVSINGPKTKEELEERFNELKMILRLIQSI